MSSTTTTTNRSTDPYLTFNGQIQYHNNEHLSNDIIDNILSNSGDNSKIVVGFDCEWNVKPYLSKVCLVQVCASADVCHLFHLSAMNYRIPSSLERLILDHNCVKVGVNIEGDIYKLQRDYGLSADRVIAGHRKSVLDLSAYANNVFGKANRWSLDGLSQFLLNRRVDKGLRLTEWSTHPLSVSQQLYAAIDAFASLEVYRAIERKQTELCC